ncbi:Myrrcad domain-containing protein [Mycoplasma feriruminatoris]|uniref:BspA family leucine-rich repeat surface protein n=1 Tax=Mycoplasma feriruminatoris TaxID=1179777 RepID=UPI00241E7F2D|nr:BspA family leucine-rich repeat surface protein [Mycoplasma feriruminatoris]WFQ95750.1 Myrrcad domain-containing protein [Mycoplasma feriruminatoris]
MKKLLTVLTSTSAVFLITAGVMLVNRNNGDNNKINYNSKGKKEHKVVGNKLTEIGYYIENGITRITHIPHSVSIIAADLPREITSLKNAFVTRSNISWEKKWDTSNITDMSGTFYNTTNINDPTIKEWDTSKVKNMSEMFSYSKGFNQDLSAWDVSNVTNMEKMFEKAIGFNNGDKPLEWGSKLKSIKNMNNMFNQTSDFTHDLSSWIMSQAVAKNKFGLEDSKQPKWKIEESKPSHTISTPSQPNNSSNISPRSDDSNDVLPSPNSGSSSRISNNEPMMVEPVEIEPRKEEPEIKEELSNKQPEIPKKENETTKNSDILKDENYKIPSIKPYIVSPIKTKTSNVGAIVGGVLGTLAVFGVAGGVGYYYRSPLKKSYFKSRDWIKEKISQIKSK